MLRKDSNATPLPTNDLYVMHPYIPADTVRIFYSCKNSAGATEMHHLRCYTSAIPLAESYIRNKKLGKV